MDTIPGTDMFSAPGYGAHDLPVGPVFPGGNVVPLATASVVPQSGLQQPANRRRSAANNGNPQNIPLLCYACPKEPKFSDQSHLLTHIASKSHLSALFSLGLSDAGANKRRRERYDDWEKTYGIQALLKGRQETKELKKQDKRKRQRGNGNEVCVQTFHNVSHGTVSVKNLPKSMLTFSSKADSPLCQCSEANQG